MAHSFYSPDEEVSFDQRSKRDTSLPVTRSTQNDSQQQEVADSSNSCVSPIPELHGKSRTINTRRRIQVACGRCRKRKIKCSGDSGDGQGCSNCRSSGNTNCQFLRVNSSLLQTKAGGWPYPAMSAGVCSSPRLGMYNHPASKATLLSMSSPNLRVASYQRASAYELGTMDPHALNRQSFPIDQGVIYEDDSPVAYSIQSPTFALPGAPSGNMVDYCGPSWSPKTWTPAMNITKPPNGALYAEQDAGAALIQGAYSYVIPGQVAQSPEIPSIFPAVTSISSDAQGTERTLPSPASRSQLQHGLPVFETSPESMSGLPFSPELKPGSPWPTAKPGASTIGSRTVMQPIPSGTFRTKSNPLNAQDVMFGFLPMNPGNTFPTPNLPSVSFAGVDTVDSPDDFRTSSDGRSTRTFSRDNGRLLSLSDCSTDIYGYSTSEKNKNRSDPADTDGAATLMNGLPYTRPDTHQALPFHPIPVEAMEGYRSQAGPHRTPISSHSNPSGY